MKYRRICALIPYRSQCCCDVVRGLKWDHKCHEYHIHCLGLIWVDTSLTSFNIYQEVNTPSLNDIFILSNKCIILTTINVGDNYLDPSHRFKYILIVSKVY